MPAAHRQVRLNVAPVKPPTQPKRAASKGKAVSHPTMRLHMHKVTWLTSPTPEVTEVEVLPSPIAGPSWVGCPPLFVDLVRLGDDHTGKGAPASSGE